MAQLLWVTQGGTKANLTRFFEALEAEVAAGIEAVAMDMWPAFVNAAAESLPEAVVVFDRFHVMQNYSKVIDQVRRAEFNKANAEDKTLLKGSRYLLLKNVARLSHNQGERLGALLAANANLNAVYASRSNSSSYGTVPLAPMRWAGAWISGANSQRRLDWRP